MVFNVGVDKQLDGFVRTVGQRELIEVDAEVTREILEGMIVFGIDAEIGRGKKALQEVEHMRRRTHRIFIEIETQLIATPSCWRMVSIHAQDGSAWS